LSKDSNLKPSKTAMISRRNLPHWEFPGSTYFITFKTAGGCILDDQSKNIVLGCVKHHSSKKYLLYACVVMSSHVHLIFKPLEVSKDSFFGLAQIMHSIKSYSAHRMQKECKIVSNVWLDEKYDRIIRNHDELVEEMSYIINNPVKDGIVKTPEDYKWLYWEKPE
jgi:putative transposase